MNSKFKDSDYKDFQINSKELDLPPFLVKEKDIERMWFKNKIMKVVETHKIRLTPTEYEELITDYMNKFYTDVSVADILQISLNIVRRNS